MHRSKNNFQWFLFIDIANNNNNVAKYKHINIYACMCVVYMCAFVI